MSSFSSETREKSWSIRCEKHFVFTSAIRRLYSYLQQRLNPEYFELVPFETITYELGHWTSLEQSLNADAFFTYLKTNARSMTMNLRGVKASMTALHIPLLFEDTRDAVWFHMFQAKLGHLHETLHSPLFHSLQIVRFKNTQSSKHLPSLEHWEECDFGELRINEWAISCDQEVLHRVPCRQFICHRGNLESKFVPDENQPSILDRRIGDGYSVELDVWWTQAQEKYWLGHDEPQYEVTFDWLMKETSKKYIHCKDGLTFEHLLLKTGRSGHKANLFYHTNEDYALTTRGHVITHPGKLLLDGSINMMPEMAPAQGLVSRSNASSYAYAVCSDTIRNLDG